MLQRIAVYHNHRRIHAALVGVAHFRAHQTGARRLLALDGALQHAGDFRGGHFNHCCIIGRLNGIEQAVDTALFQCRNIMEFGKFQKIQLAGDVALHLLAPLLADAVPFIHRHHQSPARFQRKAGNSGILVGNVLLCIKHQHRHIGRLNRLHGFNHRKFFHRFIHFAAAAHAGGVDNGEGLAFTLEIDVDAVAGGAGHVESNHTLFAENGVYQGGFAHVGAADNGKHGMFGRVGFFFRFGKVCQHLFHQVVNAITVGAGNHGGLTQRQLVELCRQHSTVAALAFVYRQKHRPRALSQAVGNDFILRGNAIARIHKKHHCIGLINRLQGVFGHFMQNAAVHHRFETAGVDHQIRFTADFAVAVMAVAREAGHIGHQGIFAAGEAVE